MTDADSLHAAILAEPAEDTPRLVLADLLQESDDPDRQARGLFLWAGVTASRFRDADVIEDSLYYAAQKEIAAIASAGFPTRWLANLGLGPRPLTKGDWMWDSTLDRVTVRIGNMAGGFTRGMLSELSVPLHEWYTVAPAALAVWPLTGGAITDVPGLTFVIGPVARGWRLVARLRLRRRGVPMRAGFVMPESVVPRPCLIEEAGDVQIEELFPDRESLVAGMTSQSVVLVAELREEVGDRWPRPPQKR